MDNCIPKTAGRQKKDQKKIVAIPEANLIRSETFLHSVVAKVLYLDFRGVR